jgi:micrococcal nuclease
MTRLVLLVATVLAGTAFLAQDLSGPVVRVIDGDTIEVELGGERERVRYIGIDTPEMSDDRPEIRALAFEARRVNARLVEGRRVRLELDVEKRDRYGRLLAYVWVGDTLVNEALVRTGHAAPYTFPPNVRYVERFVEAARVARAEADAADEATAAAVVARPNLPPGAIRAVAASARLGETVTVCDVVASATHLRSGRRPTFLNLGRPFPRQDLTVLIWGSDRGRFHAPPEDEYRNAWICVTGEIATYRGQPQIVVRAPEAIRVIRVIP